MHQSLQLLYITLIQFVTNYRQLITYSFIIWNSFCSYLFFLEPDIGMSQMLAQKYFRQLLDGVVCKPKYSISEKYITNHVTVHDSAEMEMFWPWHRLKPCTVQINKDLHVHRKYMIM